MWTTKEAEQFGLTLRRLRDQHGLTQESLAHAAGITKNQVQLLEGGRASGRKGEAGPSNPRISTLMGLATAFGMSISALLAESAL